MAVNRRDFLKLLATAGLGAGAGTGAYGYLYARHALEVTRAVVPVRGLPVGLAGLRIGLLTDIHRGHWTSHEEVSHAVERLMTERPDLVVLGGDFVTWRDRRYVRTGGRRALDPDGAARGLRRPRQP